MIHTHAQKMVRVTALSLLPYYTASLYPMYNIFAILNTIVYYKSCFMILVFLYIVNVFLPLQSMFSISSVSIKRGQHSDQWPWPVEVLYKQETIHASLSSNKDRQLLITSVGRQEGMPTTPTTPSRVQK